MIHETAIVDEGAFIGPNTKVWHWTHICAGARIGEDCVVGQGVYIGPGVQIGNRVHIQNNVFIPELVHISNDVFIGPACTFTNDKYPPSVSKENWLPTFVGSHVVFGAGCIIIAGVSIEDGMKFGAGAIIRHDIMSPHFPKNVFLTGDLRYVK